MSDYAFLSAYEIVTVCIGVNNQYRGLSLEEYVVEVEVLLRRSIALAGGRAGNVFVISIPDYGVTPFARTLNKPGIRDEVDAFNAAMQEACSGYGVEFIDITPDSRKAADEQELLASDGLHPSGKAYEQWAKALFLKLQKALELRK
jgi:lysophospholipase L1-like esterase